MFTSRRDDLKELLEPIKRRLPRKWEEQDISDLLLMLATILWPMDIAVRRIQLSPALVQKWKEWWTSRRSAPIVSETKSRVLSELQSKKEVVTVKKKAVAERVVPIEEKRLSHPISKESPPRATNVEAFNRLLEAKKKKSK